MNENRKRSNEDQRIVAGFVDLINFGLTVFSNEFLGPDDKIPQLRHTGRSGVMLLKNENGDEVEVEFRVLKRKGKEIKQ